MTMTMTMMTMMNKLRGEIMKNYSIKAIKDFIAKYCVDCLFLTDSVIGLGDQIWTMKNGRFFIVNEFFINSWTSGHHVCQRSKLTKKQLAAIDDPELNVLLQDE